MPASAIPLLKLEWYTGGWLGLCARGHVNSWNAPDSFKKLKIELPYDPVILLLGNYLKTLKISFWRHMYACVHVQ